MTDLAKTVDRRVEQLNLLPSDDSGTDDEGDNLKQSALESSTPSRPGKLKSGREAKATSDVLYLQRWPHSFLCLTRAQREVKYEELMLAEFVAGCVQILLCKDISPLEWMAREKKLVSLMYFAQQYEWSALHLESRALYWHPLQGNSPTSSSPAPVLYCRDYQRCINVKDHFGFICGERKWLRHICASCWTRLRKQEPQRENSSGCTLNALAAKGSPAPSKN